MSKVCKAQESPGGGLLDFLFFQFLPPLRAKVVSNYSEALRGPNNNDDDGKGGGAGETRNEAARAAGAGGDEAVGAEDPAGRRPFDASGGPAALPGPGVGLISTADLAVLGQTRCAICQVAKGNGEGGGGVYYVEGL